MNDELNRLLDGEIDAPDASEKSRGEADAWDRMVDSFRSAAPTGEAPPWLEQRVMAEIEALPARSGIAAWLDWLVRPTQVRVSPLMAGLVVAAFALVIALPSQNVDPGTVTPPDGVVESVVYVQFILEAPTATSVAVAGDFSQWDPAHALEDLDGDGVWTGRVPIEPGVHSYMFLIDGTEWQTDPNADSYQDDGFGNQNAVLAVAAGV